VEEEEEEREEEEEEGKLEAISRLKQTETSRRRNMTFYSSTLTNLYIYVQDNDNIDRREEEEAVGQV
ncbi:hypothetical protein L249_8707, partial [Ophiocordyceps polyrhachis-furcata BCC 54312]